MPIGVSAAPHFSALVATLEHALVVARALLAALDPAASPCCPAAGQQGTRCSPATPGPGGLSRREREVLRLLAAGQSNGQIAAALALSPRTVQRHIANLYRKIGAHCRAEATVYALRHGLA